MELSFDNISAVYDSNIPPIDAREFWNNFNEDEYNAIKHRRIPVGNGFDGLNISTVLREDGSGMKEAKRQNLSLARSIPYPSEIHPMLNSKHHTRMTQQRSKLECKIPVNPVRRKHYSDLSFLDRKGQGSVSEPTLSLVKDRGDTITLQDIYAENLTTKQHFGDGKLPLSNDRGIKGCIYIKKSGEIFKTVFDARNFHKQEGDGSSSPLRIGKKSDKVLLPVGNSYSRRKCKGDFSLFRSNGLKFAGEECGDFEIAIFLSGMKEISGSKIKNTKMLTQYKKKETEVRSDTKPKKKKRNIRKKNPSSMYSQGKSIEPIRKSFQTSSKILTINRQDKKEKYVKQASFKNQGFREETSIKNSNKANDGGLDSSSESESEILFEIPKKILKKKRRPKLIPVNSSYIVRDAFRPTNSEIQKFGNYDNASYRSRPLSLSSMGDFSDDYRMPKMKMNDEDLWERFETIFRRYASTSRHSGEVIPRKISTEWMVNAGVVDDILTEKEANTAFRQAAGAKITMNSQEYKEFLIMLTIRMKLPYYEIYRRMCGL